MITDSKRSTSYVSGTNWKCDKTGAASVSSDWKGAGADKWYRFDGSAGNAYSVSNLFLLLIMYWINFNQFIFIV